MRKDEASMNGSSKKASPLQSTTKCSKPLGKRQNWNNEDLEL